jgi:hypothetical protein
MPYRVSAHESPERVLVGTVHGHDGIAVRFAISEDGPQPHGIPPRLVRVDRNVGGGGDFWVWSDSEYWLHHGTEATWHEAADISVGIEEALCRKATGKQCPI